MLECIFKRVIAYLIDMMLISIVVSSLVSSKFVNFQLTDYQKLYDDYYEVYTLYAEQISNDIKSCEDLGKAIEKKKLTEDKYILEYEKIKEVFTKEEILEEEFNEKCNVIVDSYNANKMTLEYYEEQVNYYYYHLEKNSIMGYLVNIVFFVLYFGFFQGFTGGQTLGKKIMRLRVVSIKDEEPVKYKQLLVRTLFLPVNMMFQSVSYSILMLIVILLVPYNLFGQVTDFLYFINYILFLSILFMLCFNKGKIALHDIVVHTRVMFLDWKGKEIKDNNIKKEKEEKVEEVKNNKNKNKVKKDN
jgi:uncharacterized RDD family membrane protein YckC